MEAARPTPTSSVRSFVRFWLQATTSMPKASPTCATRAPIFRAPADRASARADRPRGSTARSPPVRRASASGTIPRARPSSRAQVSSTGGVEELAVPQTSTPCRRACVEVDDGVAHTGGDEQPQPGQPGEQLGGEGHPLAQGDHDVEAVEGGGRRVHRREVLGERHDLDVVGDGRPVDDGGGHGLEVLDDGAAQLHGSLSPAGQGSPSMIAHRPPGPAEAPAREGVRRLRARTRGWWCCRTRGCRARPAHGRSRSV